MWMATPTIPEWYLPREGIPGSGTGGDMFMFSDIFSIGIEWIERQPDEQSCDPIYVVGAGAADAGWGWNTPVEFACNELLPVLRSD